MLRCPFLIHNRKLIDTVKGFPFATLRRRMATAEVQLHSSLTSALNGVEWSSSRPDCFTRTKRTWASIEQEVRGAPGVMN